MEEFKKGTVNASRVEMTQQVLPQFTNSRGTVFGGQIMAWIDICAAVSAQRHARSAVVTASFDGVHFLKPIKTGHVVILKSKVNAVFKSSMEIGVKVIAENPMTGQRHDAIQAFCTFVSLDDYGKPHVLPPLIFETEDDKVAEKQAQARRAQRLATRESLES